MKRIKCLSCGSRDLEQILDLGLQPFADSFLTEEDKYKGVISYPLGCVACTSCWLIQTSCITSAEERYLGVDYAYNSENSSLAREHWQEFAGHDKAWGLKSNDLVVEIGSNDGYLLSLFASNGYKTLGIDPAHSQAKKARQRGLEIIEEIFTSDLASTVNEGIEQKAVLIIANNVFNHSNDPLDFLEGVAKILHKDGTFVFEVPYWGSLIADGKFEQVYHEHVSYFTVQNLSELVMKTPFSISKIAMVDYHGGSLRVELQFKENDGFEMARWQSKWIEEENQRGLFDLTTYKNFQENLVQIKKSFMNSLIEYKKEGYSIGALGAAAKGNTILNWLGLESSLLDFVLDSSPYKIGKRTPGSDILIHDDDYIASLDKVVLIVLAWNISTVVVEKLRKINPKAEFIGVNFEIN